MEQNTVTMSGELFNALLSSVRSVSSEKQGRIYDKLILVVGEETLVAYSMSEGLAAKVTIKVDKIKKRTFSCAIEPMKVERSVVSVTIEKTDVETTVTMTDKNHATTIAKFEPLVEQKRAFCESTFSYAETSREYGRDMCLPIKRVIEALKSLSSINDNAVLEVPIKHELPFIIRAKNSNGIEVEQLIAHRPKPED